MRLTQLVSLGAWFGRGLQFQCTLCGKCCKAPDKPVWVNEREIEKMAMHLGLDPGNFNAKYIDGGDNKCKNGKLLIKRNKNDFTCSLLKDNKCSVHEAKPIQCATYPFWPEYMVSELDWNAEAQKCEGMVPVNMPHLHNEANRKLNEEQSKFVPRAEILKNMVVEEISRSGEVNAFCKNELEMFVSASGPQYFEDFSKEFWTENKRRIVHEDSKYLVIDSHLCGEQSETRSLVFKDAPSFVQTEIPLDTKEISTNRLISSAHRGLMLGLLALDPQPSALNSSQNDRQFFKNPLNVAVIGAGCGAIPKFLKETVQGVEIDAVDVDRNVLDVGQTWFGFEQDATLRIHCMDGMQFLHSCQDSQFDCIFIDVAESTKRQGEGQLDAPPAAFYAPNSVKAFHEKLTEGGVVAVNVIGDNAKFNEVSQALFGGFGDAGGLNLSVCKILCARKGGQMDVERLSGSIRDDHFIGGYVKNVLDEVDRNTERPVRG